MDPGTISVLVALAGAWAVQVILSSHQMRRYHRRSQELRRLGTHMATGVAGSTYRRKVYACLVVDAGAHGGRRVVAAERLSGWTVAARLRPVPQVVGLDLDMVGKEDPPAGVSSKEWAAFDHSADFIRSHLAKTARITDRSGRLDARPSRRVPAAAGTASQ